MASASTTWGPIATLWWDEVELSGDWVVEAWVRFPSRIFRGRTPAWHLDTRQGPRLDRRFSRVGVGVLRGWGGLGLLVDLPTLGDEPFDATSYHVERDRSDRESSRG